VSTAISGSQLRIAARVLVLVLAGLSAPARAQSPDPSKTERPEQGVNASATYDGETVSDLTGGAKRGSTYHGSLQLQAAFDFERLFGWADTTGFLYGMGLHGGQPDDFVGGAQGVSSITGPRGARLDEAWLQRKTIEVEGLTVAVIGRSHLIQNKKAVGRPQDLADVMWLERHEP